MLFVMARHLKFSTKRFVRDEVVSVLRRSPISLFVLIKRCWHAEFFFGELVNLCMTPMDSGKASIIERPTSLPVQQNPAHHSFRIKKKMATVSATTTSLTIWKDMEKNKTKKNHSDEPPFHFEWNWIDAKALIIIKKNNKTQTIYIYIFIKTYLSQMPIQIPVKGTTKITCK